MTLLDVRHLRKAYGALAATDDVSLSVEAGELHAVIGPNGAGKTTLIHQLSGALFSDSGSINFADADVTRVGMVGRVRRGLARSFQITSVLEGFRCWRTPRSPCRPAADPASASSAPPPPRPR